MKRSDIPTEEIIAACRAFHAGTAKPPDESLGHKYPVKVILAKMEQMADNGLIEYGTSLRCAWVVETLIPPDAPA